MKKIIVKNEFKKDHISREAGERLRDMIKNAYRKKQKIEIDFDQVVIASTSFFDEGIAKLALVGWNKDRFDQFVKIRNLNPRDAEVMKKMCQYRGLYQK